MKVMIIGCGRVGSVLANRLDEVGHQVVVLERNQQAFRRLSEKFSGYDRYVRGFCFCFGINA